METEEIEDICSTALFGNLFKNRNFFMFESHEQNLARFENIEALKVKLYLSTYIPFYL